MAKQQPFTDKASKKKGKSLGTFVKYIKSILSEKTGHWRFNEQIVNIKDGENLDSALKRIEEEKQAMAEFGSSDSGASLGDILGAALEKKNQTENK